ncbi:PilZ domain-containing protein [Bowmanella dokdonensis]|uniref:PilZ domain-containing protein n=1 Tax=Bowmanella dokdonensis TaxID=751969 RepID=A0A939DL86_9ALTE|nr:PilZ domain-containing protein [Bowmanella dokdonensis]MBN7824630.1 PilZ domain-containing protein [Bowmanella dokdonensis]
MEKLTLEQKKQQFDEFFRIRHALKVNMRLLEEDFELPAPEQLAEHMPYAFRIASELSALDAAALRPLRNLSEHAADLVKFLNHQSRKIDLMMSYILHEQMAAEHQFSSQAFGGGGVILLSGQPIELERNCELRLFLEEEAAAVFCYGEVIACEKVDDQYHISLFFNRIREEDQELLVRASLHLQTLQLRKRAQNKSPSE